jgi:hypothetical protein
MSKFGLVGPSYTSQAVNADCQSCQNWYVELMESQDAKSRAVLYPTPGLSVFATLPDTPVRAEFTINGRTFAIGGGKFCEIDAAGNVTVRGDVFRDATQAYIIGGTNQLAMCCSGHLYAFTLATNAFVEVDTTTGVALQGPVSWIGYSDGYYIALLANSSKFQISALLDATVWDPLDIAQVEVFADNVIGAIVDHRELWLCGPKSSQPYQNTGNPLFPFEVIPGAFIENGIVAQGSLCRLDNSIFALGADERGSGIAWRAQGYLPTRISNHAVEFAWQGYSTISDAIGYSYQDQGHAFWVLYFPTADKTWVYDVATQMWHERSSMINGLAGAHLGRCHVFAFGKHLVGDRLSGKIYQMSISIYTDNGIVIERVRRAPHISAEDQWIMFTFLQVILESGLATLKDGNDQFIAPVMNLRWSDDGGHTWSNYHQMGCGKLGEYKTRVFMRRLGRARDRVFEISTSDPIPWRVIDGYLQTAGGQ